MNNTMGKVLETTVHTEIHKDDNTGFKKKLTMFSMQP